MSLDGTSLERVGGWYVRVDCADPAQRSELNDKSAGTRFGYAQKHRQLPTRQKWMAGDKAKHLLRLTAESVIVVCASDRRLPAGEHSSAQWLFACATRHLLEQRLPGCYPGHRASTCGNTDNQERFLVWVGV
jgi:hypothetical protein